VDIRGIDRNALGEGKECIEAKQRPGVFVRKQIRWDTPFDLGSYLVQICH